MAETDIEELREERLKRLLPTGRGVWIPIDHGASDWPVDGLQDIGTLVEEITRGRGADAIVCHRGPLKSHYDNTHDNWRGGWVLHLSVSTRHSGDKAGWKVLAGEAVNVVVSAVERGATGVSVQVNLGDENESNMLATLASVADECQLLGVPLLGMMYPRGEYLKLMDGDDTNGVAHAARIGWEMGCDVVKVPWTGSIESFQKVTSSVPIPVLVSGGPKGNDFRDVIRMVRASMAAGGSGVCIGRQIFADEDSVARIAEIIEVVHGIPWDADGRFKFDSEEADELDDLYESFRNRLNKLD
ncbi:MAG: fructose-bisphosphate aldolase [Thermoplasmata archaeon]|nr:fructose-bisphosphate aldolase [Thermoplasmata archaeon]